MIMPKVFAAEMITTVRAKIEADDEFKTLDFVSIFKEVGSNTFDEFRKMAPVKQKVNKKLKDEATLLIKKFHMRACLVARSKIHIKTPQQSRSAKHGRSSPRFKPGLSLA
ncbi:hypothetical protein PF010_g18729 [Phytophthora fragariae]|uniref:Uncharacterized protein n=1 Tax=Phytophthora fragariae TaxID=53985 RepID=A0A6A3SNX4_9STRA|nr:hypothetical protein PF003_g18134 [Phytophthora fragariae]KAE9090079.1 hypothetical protein PF010_g18729 [Phytophthora fragariae]KAE9115444.1 hypothetical protein PF006_g19289 [Phytophthora fragariae]KAE9214054.1 hypothetical protein PF004_g15155 [Phytophthora fragariae]KAE9300180.1 hypothetical protein PF001_g15083 [Phytophthora fragariae]